MTGMVTRIRQHAKGHLYIDQWLEAKNLTYEIVGDRLGVSRTTVWRWAKEQHRLNPGKIDALAKAIGVDKTTDLYRLPDRPERVSIDAILADAPQDTYEAIVDFAKRLTKKAS